jgi:selenium-binding protein 1
VLKVCLFLQIVEPEEVHAKCDLGTPHTVHCLGNGEVMISAMGDSEGNAKGKIIMVMSGIRILGHCLHVILKYLCIPNYYFKGKMH